jgi:hypothetical protein
MLVEVLLHMKRVVVFLKRSFKLAISGVSLWIVVSLPCMQNVEA